MKIVFFLVGLVLVSGQALGADSALFSEWVAKQAVFSERYLFDNISPAGTARGVVVASPSKTNPDYFYHWIRDASLVMDVVVDLYAGASGAQKARYEAALLDYIDFSRVNQTTPNPSGGLGEPKFNVDGSAFTGSWGRPQNDGPALRAVALIHLANLWLGEGKENLVREKLYRMEIPATTVVKADLEYVSHHWRETCFDLWEESKGHHFYTQMVQRRAMVEGARLAARLGDGGAAAWYRAQAAAIENELNRYWNEGRKIIVVTLDRDGGIDYKSSGQDAGTLLGVMHGNTADGVFSATDSRVLSTLHEEEITFARIYAINQKGMPAVAIGRYPEDRYDGYSTGREGNPWVLLTAGFGELYHRIATRFELLGVIKVDVRSAPFFGLRVGEVLRGDRLAKMVAQLRSRGDEYLDRVRVHGPGEGRFAEQINRAGGYMQGASNLTWNYAALLTALRARPR